MPRIIIITAQALSLNLPASDFVIATTNIRHIQIFTPAEEWQKIVPGS